LEVGLAGLSLRQLSLGLIELHAAHHGLLVDVPSRSAQDHDEESRHDKGDRRGEDLL